MKVLSLIGLILGGWASPLLAGQGSAPDLVIATYDSMMTPGGLGEVLQSRFEKKCGCTIQFLPSGDGGQLLTRMQLEAAKPSPQIHVVLGIDQQLWFQAQAWSEVWTPQSETKLEKQALVAPGFVPFDAGMLTWEVDQDELQARKLPVPSSLSDLIKPEYRKSLLLEDPRTSTPGMAFLLFTRKILGEGFTEYWSKLRNQWLTLAPSWDAAYGLFLKKESPLVWTYTSSEAYHRKKGQTKYRAIALREGGPLQIEGAVVVKGVFKNPRVKKLAQEFLEFLLSEEIQKEIPERNWMFPTRKGVSLPSSYSGVVSPWGESGHGVRVEIPHADYQKLLEQWKSSLSR